MVDWHAINSPCREPPAHAPTLLEDDDVLAQLLGAPGGGQARQASAYDDNGSVAHLPAWCGLGP